MAMKLEPLPDKKTAILPRFLGLRNTSSVIDPFPYNGFLQFIKRTNLLSMFSLYIEAQG
jgi:hypothetical protein